MPKIIGFVVSTFVLIITLTVSMPSVATSLDTEIAASSSMMQCMTKCIKDEGDTSTAKNTCKLRCANVPIPNARAGGKDCMSIYKKCNRTCRKGDKTCKRACKGNLMQCK